MRKILFRIFVILTSLFIIVSIFTMFHISFLGFRIYRIGSGSMSPYLKVNDYILIKESKEYEKNDVVTYKTENEEYVTHRIIYIDENEIITKGDSNKIEDPPINENMIIGKVVARLGMLGFILYLFSNPISWILLFLFGIIITSLKPKKEK